MKPVLSSHVSALHYDPDAATLDVIYTNGNHVRYKGVPPEKAEQIENAPSIGLALRYEIRGQYDFEYVKRIPRKRPR